jgi:hypothetical protein
VILLCKGIPYFDPKGDNRPLKLKILAKVEFCGYSAVIGDPYIIIALESQACFCIQTKLRINLGRRNNSHQ